MTLTSQPLSKLMGDLQVFLMEVSPERGEGQPLVRSPHPDPHLIFSQISLCWSVEHTQLPGEKMLIHKTTNPGGYGRLFQR